MLELGKPIQACPACGDVNGVKCWPETKDYWENHEENPQVRCDKCGVRGPEKSTEDEAIDAWNAMLRRSRKAHPCDNCEMPCEYEGEEMESCMLEAVAYSDKW